MTAAPDPYTEVAEAVIDHAVAMTRLNPRTLGADGFAAAAADHVRSMRVLAAAQVDPMPDRRFVRALNAVVARTDDVLVRFEENVLHVFVDNPHREQRFELISLAQLDRRGESADERIG